jgi:LysM repeat protein
MATELVDYSFARPNLAQVKAAGIAGVIRYLTGSGKSLTTGEIAQIRAAGLSLALVYETTGQTVKGGRSAGVADGQAALSALGALGLPRSVVYFAVDYDLQPGEYGLLDAYLDGVASVLGKQYTGLYAGYGPCAHAIGRGYAAWQTYAWSGGRVAQGIKLYQYQNGVTIGGGQVDRNRTSLPDHGQVKWGGAAPAPAADLNALADAVIRGEYGNGETRKARLGANYAAVQAIVDARLAAAKPAQSASPAGTYTVRAGDTLSGIAAANGTTWQRLQQINNLPNPNLIHVGQSIRLDGAAPAKPAPAPAATYTVRPGDNLSAIAAAHRTTWQALAAKNHISNPNLIYPGQTITL